MAYVLDDWMSEVSALGAFSGAVVNALAPVALPAVATAGAIVASVQGVQNIQQTSERFLSEGVGLTGAKITEGTYMVTTPSGTISSGSFLPSFALPASFAPPGTTDVDFESSRPLALSPSYDYDVPTSYVPASMPLAGTRAASPSAVVPDIIIPTDIIAPTGGSGGYIQPRGNREPDSIIIPPVLTAGVGGGVVGGLLSGGLGNALGSIGGTSVPAINISINVQSNNREDILDL